MVFDLKDRDIVINTQNFNSTKLLKCVLVTVAIHKTREVQNRREKSFLKERKKNPTKSER